MALLTVFLGLGDTTAVAQGIPLITITVGGEPIGEGVTWPYPGGPKTARYKIPTYKLTVQAEGSPDKHEFEAFRFGVMQKDGENAKVVGLQDEQAYNVELWLPEYKVHSQASEEVGAWRVFDNFLIHDGPDDPKDSDGPFATIGCIEVCGKKKFDSFNDLLIKLSALTTGDRAAKLNKLGSSKRIRVSYEESKRPALIKE